MAFNYLPLLVTFISFASLNPSKSEFLDIKSARNLDLAIRDHTFRSYNTNFKTGEVRKIELTPNLSDISVDLIRLRCGSLQRYGANIKEFHIPNGTNVHPCITRVFLVRQSVGFNWSSLYYNDDQLSGYQLISPVLGLKAYSIDDKVSSNPTELSIQSGKTPITIDFTTAPLLNTSSRISPLCATFDGSGKVSLSSQKDANVCVAKGNGHFGLVVESPLMPFKGKVGKVKIVVVSSIGAALGAFLLSLLMVAMLAKAKKKKERMDEMERRAYEEEALQVSMVGHVRAGAASGTRTAPTIQHHPYRTPYS